MTKQNILDEHMLISTQTPHNYFTVHISLHITVQSLVY